MGSRVLVEARALRAAFPDPTALRGVEIGAAPAGGGDPALASAMRDLWDEVVRVRDGKAETRVVLDDETAHVEDLLARL